MNIYRVSLDGEAPIISAMRGHDIDGGFVFGLFTDFVVFSRESVVTANFWHAIVPKNGESRLRL